MKKLSIKKIEEYNNIADGAGISIEELNSNISQMNRIGLPSHQVISGFKAMINLFADSNDESKMMANGYGFELTRTGLKEEGISSIIKKLKHATAADLKTMFPNIRTRQILHSLILERKE